MSELQGVRGRFDGDDSDLESAGPSRPWREVGVVLALLSPVVAAVWLVPCFVTQDGMSHLYNAWIIGATTAGDSVVGSYYEVRWRPLPNWAGHLALVGLLRAVTPWAADRIVMTGSLLGLAAASIWLRSRVSGGRGSIGACALAAVLALDFSWLMGFASFQIAACLFPITLGVWWKGRDDLRGGRMAALSTLLVLGYFGHLVSLGLTACALLFLADVLPAERSVRRRRLVRTAACMAPLAGLAALYVRLSREGGPMAPSFPAPGEFLSVTGWLGRLGWVDPISVAVKDGLPFSDRVGPWFTVFSPAVWLVLAGALGAATACRRRRGASDRPTDERRAWRALAAILFMGGVLGPDALGPGHGEFLPQRIALFGLVALVPTLGRPGRWTQRAAAGAVLTALALQTVVVWDYALDSQKKVSQLLSVGSKVGRGERVATLLAVGRSRFRVNAALHADGWTGVSREAILWSNYETRHYYFPVRFRPGLTRPDSADLERIALLSGSDEAERRWSKLLETYHGVIDAVIALGAGPGLDAITERWYEPTARAGEARLYRRREGR